MFTLRTTTTSDLRQADRPTSGSSDLSEVNLRLALRCHYAYGLRHYVVI